MDPWRLVFLRLVRFSCPTETTSFRRAAVRVEPGLGVLQGAEIQERFGQGFQPFDGQLADALLDLRGKRCVASDETGGRRLQADSSRS